VLGDKTYVAQTRTAGVVAYDLEVHKEMWRIATGSASFCRCAIGAYEAPLVACANEHESTLAVWDARSRDYVWQATPDDVKCGMLMETRFLDAEHVAGVYEDGELRVFSLKIASSPVNASRSSQLLSLAVQPNANVATSFDVVSTSTSPLGCFTGMAGGASDQLASFTFNLASGVGESTLFAGAHTAGKGTGVGMLRIRPSDGRIAAVASWDSRVRIVHVTTSRHLAVLKDHAKAVQCVAFSRDGSLLASGGSSCLIAEYCNLFTL